MSALIKKSYKQTPPKNQIPFWGIWFFNIWMEYKKISSDNHTARKNFTRNSAEMI